MGAVTWQRIYWLSLYLYPYRFRQAFGAEMQEVFDDVLAEEQQKGTMGLVRLSLREFGGLPYNALRQHAAPMIDGFVEVFGRHLVWAAVVGYALGLMLLNIPRVLLPDAPCWCSLNASPGYYLLIFLSGWIGGSMLGLSIRREGSRWFGLVGGFSQLISLLLVNILYRSLFPDWGSRVAVMPIQLLIILGYPLLMGLFLGGILGSFRENWKYVLRFALFGMAGFVLGYLGERLVSALMQSYLLNPVYNPFPGLAGAWTVLFIVFPPLVYGAVIGAALGLANRKPRMLRMRLAI